MAVRLAHNILVFGGRGPNHIWKSNREIWTYNLYTEQWKKHVIAKKGIAPPATWNACAVTIEQDVFMFGGETEFTDSTNTVWKLTRTSEGSFVWSSVTGQDNTKVPTPRERHCGWEYAGKLWVFGGFSDRTEDEHGDFNGYMNNQLLCFNPHSEEWTNPQCFGTVPAPGMDRRCTVVGDIVWLYGDFHWCDDEFYQLDMSSFG